MSMPVCQCGMGVQPQQLLVQPLHVSRDLSLNTKQSELFRLLRRRGSGVHWLHKTSGLKNHFFWHCRKMTWFEFCMKYYVFLIRRFSALSCIHFQTPLDNAKKMQFSNCESVTLDHRKEEPSSVFGYIPAALPGSCHSFGHW